MTLVRARGLRGGAGGRQPGADGLHGQDVGQQMLLLLLAVGLGPLCLDLPRVLHVPHVELLQLLDVAVPGAAHLALGQVGRGLARDKSTWVSLGLLVQIRGVARGQAILKQQTRVRLAKLLRDSLEIILYWSFFRTLYRRSYPRISVQHPDESLFVI